MASYRFKEDYEFDNDIFGVRALGADVLKWSAAKDDEVQGTDEEDGYITLIGGIQDNCSIEASALEKIK